MISTPIKKIMCKILTTYTTSLRWRYRYQWSRNDKTLNSHSGVSYRKFAAGGRLKSATSYYAVTFLLHCFICSIYLCICAVYLFFIAKRTN